MEITRRGLLKAGTVAGVGLTLPTKFAAAASGASGAGLTRFTEPLPTLTSLGVLDLRNATSSTATITMVNAKHRFHSAMGLTDTFAYRSSGGNQTYLGPVIVARQGQPVAVTVMNDLAVHPLRFAIDPALVPSGTADASRPRASTHLHGGNTDPANDGGPLDTFLPGSSRTYSYANAQEASPLWYHDHAVGITRLNVHAGLAGGYLIRNAEDPGDGSTGLPPAPTYEVPLILQDRMFEADGTFAYPPNPFPSTPRPWAPEFFGDVATVNGKAWPNLDVDRGKYRFRVYNGSNARVYDLKLVTNGSSLRFFQVGTDGGLLDAPVSINRLVLAPGERADLVVDFAGLAAGTTVVMTNSARTPYPDGPRAERLGGSPLPQVMRFQVGARTGWTAPLPGRLRARLITRLSRFTPARVRTMTLVEILDEAESPLMALLNNRTFMDGEDFKSATISADSLERWELVNLTGDAHPIHLHFTQFQVLNRQRLDAEGYQNAVYGEDEALVPNTGPYPPPSADPYLIGTPRAPDANERGWKDTVVAMPGQVTRILVPFGAGAANGEPLAMGSSYTGDYVWHCHILEHEDNDMMQHFRVV
jgi:FtsP/CotA-like multicopper oxidase with cupredoxin domain